MDLFDSHCHLQDARLEPDLGGVMLRARANKVTNLVCCGTRPSDWAKVRSLARKYEWVIPAYGVHPWYAEDAVNSDWEAELQAYLEADPVAGVGEIGLDGAIRPRNLERQQIIFSRQLRLAEELGRVVSVHCRRAWQPLLDVLQSADTLPEGVLIHSYSGSVELVESLARFNVFFSFSGSITNPKYARAGDLVRAVPRDRLLVETDAPDMIPYPLRGDRTVNEPCNLASVIDTVAGMIGLSFDEIADITTRNAKTFFSGA